MLEKMKEIVAEQLSCDASEVELSTNFKDDLGADSLDLFELVMALEEEYDVEIPQEDLASINTVEDVINYLKDKGIEAQSKHKKGCCRFICSSQIYIYGKPIIMEEL